MRSGYHRSGGTPAHKIAPGRPELRCVTFYDGVSRMIVRVGGEVDMATVAQLECALTAAINQGTRQVVVDLKAVSFISSEGLGAVARACQRAEATGGSLYVVAAEGRVTTAIAVTGLAGTFCLRARIADIPPPALDRRSAASDD